VHGAERSLRDALAKGLGRAHLLLAAEPSPAACETLVEACLTTTAYDPQVEGSRVPFLTELVRLAGIEAPLAGALGPALGEAAGPEHDAVLAQRWELAGWLAREGHAPLRAAMHAGLVSLVDRWLAERESVRPPCEPARQLVLLGEPVIAFAQLGRLVREGQWWFEEELLEEARAVVGPDLDRVLVEARGHDADVAAYLGSVEHTSAAERGAPPAPRPRVEDMPWSEVRRAIEEDGRGWFQWSQWGKRASDADLAEAARALVQLDPADVDVLRSYLWVFGRRAVPLEPARLVACLDDSRDRVAWFAAKALEQVAHPAVRAAALRLAGGGPLREHALGLLAANWRPGDEAIAKRLLGSESDVHSIHTIGMSLRDVAKRHAGERLVPALLLGYERTPCAKCRGDFVEALLALGALPEELRRECRHDSWEETRRLVASP
jgi:hypothetical protein